METFEQFMQRALHDPERGYYARRITSIGGRGDFTTAPMLSEAPARAIAAWVATALRSTRCLDLIEAGPGEGKLAHAVLRHLPWPLRWRVRLHLVETSAPFAAKQRELLGKRAVWHKEMTDALASCNGRAVIYSNELVDAFPVRRFQNTPDGWREIAVDFPHALPAREILLAPAPLPESSVFAQSHPPGQRVEVHDSYHQWLASWMPHWKSGRMLTIDYGATVSQLYHRRPHGTLRAYLLQHRLEGPAIYENVGRQDLTADVNFTDLMDWSRPWVQSQRLESFGDFLRPFAKANEALLDEQGPAGAFQALDQTR